MTLRPLKFRMSKMAVNEFIVNMQINKRKPVDNSWKSDAFRRSIQRGIESGYTHEQKIDDEDLERDLMGVSL